MNIEKLTIKNFLTIGEAELELDSRGLLLIQGENKANPSATSNGAGKSSLVDALCWGLYGETARGETGDAVVNEVAKKDCQVATVVRDSDMEYRIVRYRKDSKLKNHLTVSQRDASGVGTDLTKGTDKETQEVVNRIMGCSLDVFVAAIYAGQEKMPDLPGMTDKQLKVLIEEAAGVEVLETAYKIARDKLTAVEKGKAVCETQIASLDTKLANDRVMQANVGLKAKEFEEGRKARAGAELANVPGWQKVIAEMSERLAKVDTTALIAEKAKLEADLAGYKTAAASVEVHRAAHERFVRQERDTSNRYGNLAVLRDKLVAEVVNIDKKVGSACGECGKHYCEHDLETAKSALETKLDAVAKEMERTKVEVGQAMTDCKEAETVYLKAKAALPDVTATSTRLREVADRLGEAAMLTADIKGYNDGIENAKTAARGKLAEANPYTAQQTFLQTQIDKGELDLVSKEAELGEIAAQCALLADAVKVFSPAGVRAHILDTVTPYLNERTSEYLGALTDGDTQATWSTLQAGAKGALKEKFNISVQSTTGGSSFGLLSGGEKRKVRLGCAMALQDMVASRATKPINIFVADEIDHALDEAGLERLMGILNTKAKERGTVLVVSHQSLADWIDSVITVTKTAKGKSLVSGETRKVM